MRHYYHVYVKAADYARTADARSADARYGDDVRTADYAKAAEDTRAKTAAAKPNELNINRLISKVL